MKATHQPLEKGITLHTLIVGPIQTNCYIIAHDASQRAVIIDPGAGAQGILDLVKAEGLKVTHVVNTHGHWDHVNANADVIRGTGALLAVGGSDAAEVKKPGPDLLLHDGDTLDAGGLRFEVIGTPGHTPGGICLYRPGSLFSGDTLFLEDVGRTDLKGGSEDDIRRSIHRLLSLPQETRVFPGHDEPTTIAHERRTNPMRGGL